MRRLRDRLPHPRSRTDDAIERVKFTISTIVCTPRPSSPIKPAARGIELDFARSVAAIAELVFESLEVEDVLRRRPAEIAARENTTARPGACASTKNASDIGAEQNHLWPTSAYSADGPPEPTGVAVVALARTSEPPCFSVIAMPKIAEPFCGAAAAARRTGAKTPAAPRSERDRAPRAAPAPRRASSRSGTRDPTSAWLHTR
jgi:hypothetical protein